jgi:hypothetical protein
LSETSASAAGGARLHRLVEAVGEHDVAAPCIDARQPELLDLRGGVLPISSSADVMLAPRLLVAPRT